MSPEWSITWRAKWNWKSLLERRQSPASVSRKNERKAQSPTFEAPGLSVREPPPPGWAVHAYWQRQERGWGGGGGGVGDKSTRYPGFSTPQLPAGYTEVAAPPNSGVTRVGTWLQVKEAKDSSRWIISVQTTHTHTDANSCQQVTRTHAWTVYTCCKWRLHLACGGFVGGLQLLRELAGAVTCCGVTG